MSRITSREAIKQLAEAGTISALQWEVLEAMRRSSRTTMTARELMTEGCCNGAWKRLSELKLKSLVVEDGIKTCSVTGKRAIAWKLGDGTVPEKKLPTWTYDKVCNAIRNRNITSPGSDNGFVTIDIRSYCPRLEETAKAIVAMLNRRFP